MRERRTLPRLLVILCARNTVREEYFTRWPHVKNLVAHNSLSNWGRMHDGRLDR